MNLSCEFVYVLVLKDGAGNDYLAISPCGSAAPKDLVILKNGVICVVHECIYIDKLSKEFALLEKMIELSEVYAVYGFIWEKPEDDNGTVPGDS